MARVTYSSSSPYFDTKQTSWYLMPITLRSIPPHSSDVPILLPQKYENKPTLLSNDVYGTPAYWWVFMVRNLDVIRDPIWDMKTGIQIMVPTKSRISDLLG